VIREIDKLIDEELPNTRMEQVIDSFLKFSSKEVRKFINKCVRTQAAMSTTMLNAIMGAS